MDETILVCEFMKYFTVKNEKEYRIIQVELLLAVEVNDYLCTFYAENEPPFSCVESLGKILSELPDCFIRISRNCIVSVQHIKSIDFKNRKVRLSGNMTFSFSTRNAKALKQMFDK